MLGKIFKKFNNPDIKPITGLDATFLYGETPTSPMHVGGLAIVEGTIAFDAFLKRIQSRLHLIPKLRKRLMWVPLSIDYPYWVDDPNFDINLHVSHIALPKPGDWKALRKVASKIFSEPLDQSRPLWSFTFVEGLDNMSQVPSGSVAIISKIHHVAIDGMAGAGILSVLFDLSPTPPKMPPPKPFNPKPLPNELNLILKSSLSFAEKPLKLPRIITSTLASTLKAGFLTRVKREELPTAPFSAPPSILNGIISARRKWNTVILSLERIKALKRIMDVTMNDVMLAICAGALRRYLLEKQALPNKPLVAMVPISTRTKTEEKNLGNQISNMLIQLATNIENPIERLEEIHENTVRGKMYQNAIGAKTLANMAEVVPFGIANQAARLYSRYHISEMHNPVFNVTITNVPGPQVPLYLDGHKLYTIMGMAPIIDGMGLIIAIFSYNGKVTVSSTSDAKTMPDLNTFSRYLRESANELEALILAKADQLKEKSKTPPKPKSDALFEHIQNFIKDNPTAIRANSGIYQFNITGPISANWQADFNEQPGKVETGETQNPDTTLTVKDEHLYRIATGDLNIQAAFIQGRLKIEGDSKKAMKLMKILSIVPPLPKQKS